MLFPIGTRTGKPARKHAGREAGWRGLRPTLELLENRIVPATLFVDDDLAQCPDADYQTISEAVAAADPGDTIHVCEGFYNESVTVDKTLTLLGDDQKAVVQPPAGLTGFSLLANDIVLSGFTVQGATNNAGIYTSPLFSGYQIRDNLIQDNTFGLYLHSSGATESVVEGNTFEENNVPGAAAGNGIYADQGTVNVRIEDNTFLGHVNAAILFANAGTPQEDIIISRNHSLNDATFVALFGADDVVIERNVIEDDDPSDNELQGSKIFVGGDSNDVLIQRNRIEGGGFDGIAVRDMLGTPGGTSGVLILDNDIRGVDQDGISVTATAEGAVEVRSNRISDVGRHGVYLGPATSGNLVADNKIFRSGQDGISLEGSDDNVIENNKTFHSGRDGIRADANSTGNTISGNHMRHNDEHDAHDDSVGDGTAGTANTWDGNKCETENREGLCEKKKKQS